MTALVAVAGMAGRSAAAMVSPPVILDFAGWLASTDNDAGPAHYWKLDDTSGTTVTTETGGLTGTYVNTGDLELGITDAAGEIWTGFGGTNGAFTILNPITTAAFTLLIRLQYDAAPSTMTIATSGFTSTAGQYLIQTVTDGAGGLKLKLSNKDGSGVSVVHDGTNPNTVPVGTVLHLVVQRPGDAAPRAWVHDVDAGTMTEVLFTLNTGTVPATWAAPPSHTAFFCSNTAGGTAFDGVASHLAIWDKALSESDILALGDISPLPEPIVVWARALDAGSVTESEALADISVLTHIHPSTGYTLSVVDGTGTNGTLTTDGTDLTYTASTVSGDQTDSGTSWRITKGGVNSPTVTFTIDVLEDSAAAESDQANCFVEPGLTTVTIGSGSGSIASALLSAVNAAQPGTHILIATGTYTGGTVTLNKTGTEANPIVIRPQSGLGTVTINNANWTMANTSSWLAISKLHFSSSRISMLGDHNRVTRCRFRDITGQTIAWSTTRDTRVDHCDFATFAVGATASACIAVNASWRYRDGLAARNLIDHCYFHDLTGATNNQVIDGASDGETNTPRGGIDMARGTTVTVDTCFFENINCASEYVILKVGGMIWRYNTFVNCDGYFQTRASGHTEVRSNWFENAGELKGWGKDNLWIGNRLMGNTNLWCPCGNGTHAGHMSGAYPTNQYELAEASSYIGNRLTNGHVQIGRWHNANPLDEFPLLPATGNLIAANTRDSGGSAHEFLYNHPTLDPVTNPGDVNTTISETTAETFTPAVKLTSADVGLTATDPLCD